MSGQAPKKFNSVTPPSNQARPAVGELKTLHNLHVKPRFDEIVRLLGNRPKTRPKPALEKQIRDLVKSTGALAKPRCIYGIFHLQSPSLSWLQLPCCTDVDYLALGAVTIGNALTDKVTSMTKGGDMAQATIVDAIGSELVERGAEIVDEIINTEAAQYDLQGLPRLSPGYGEWSIDQQADLIRTIDAHSIGLTVSSSMLMTPRKSISFAIPLLPLGTLPRNKKTNHCSTCEFVNCSVRSTTGETQ